MVIMIDKLWDKWFICNRFAIEKLNYTIITLDDISDN